MKVVVIANLQRIARACYHKLPSAYVSLEAHGREVAIAVLAKRLDFGLAAGFDELESTTVAGN